MKKSTKRAILGIALISMIGYSVLGLYGYVPFPFHIGGTVSTDYKVIDVYGKIVNQQGNAIGTTATAALYDKLGISGLPAVAPLASDACDSSGEFILTSVPSDADYWINLYTSTPTTYWQILVKVHVNGVLKTSEETSVRFVDPFILPLIATTYTESIEAGGTIVSRTQAAAAMTTDTEFPVTAGVDTEFTFKTLVGTYSTRALEWSLPRYSNVALHGVWLVESNATFQVSQCPYTYDTYSASGVANYTLVFDALPATAYDTSTTVSQTLKFKWSTATGTPSFEVYFLWNTTVATLKSALTMGGATGTHLTGAGVASPIPSYVAGLFQVTDGTYTSVNTS